MALTRVRQQQINTTVTGFDDPVVPINAAQVGENTNDIGFIFNRGTLDNAAIIWDEANDTFKIITTTNGGNDALITANIADANLTAGSIFASSFVGSLSGNADSADKLTTPRLINGVAFDGTQNITIESAATNANAIIGNVLSANVLYSSLTSVGTLSNLTVTGIANLSNVDASGNVVIQGNLIVNGVTTTLNTSVIDVEDINITLGKGLTTTAAANGAGITVDGPANATIAYNSATDSWDINKPLTANSFSGSGSGLTSIPNTALVNSNVTVNGTAIDLGSSATVTANASTLSGTYLNSTVQNSSLITVGNLTSVYVVGDSTIRGNVHLPSIANYGILLDNEYAWKDIIGDVSPRTGNALAASLKQFQGEVYGWAHTASSVGDLTYHMPHDYAVGSDLNLHVHWGHNGTNITGSFIVTFYASYAKRSYPATSFSSPVTLSLTLNSLNMTNSPRYCHRVDEILLSTPGGSANLLNTNNIEVDGLVTIHYAINTIPSITGSDFSNLPYIQTIDIHMQSTGIGTSRKDPGYYT